jgi:hypothetical protein
MPVKLGEAISRSMGTLQRCPYPASEGSRNRTSADKEQQLVSSPEPVQIELFVFRKADHHYMEKELLERESIGGSFAAAAVRGYPTTPALIEALETTSNLHPAQEQISVRGPK